MCGKLKEKAIAAVYLCLWVQALRHMQLDYEKRVRDVEKQRGQLLAEMDTREVELLKRIDILEEDKRVLERRLKKSVSERDHFYELNTILASENDRLAVLSPFLPPPSLIFMLLSLTYRLKREMDYQKEELQSRRRGELNAQGELNHYKKESERLYGDLEKLMWYKQEYTSLTHANDSLKQDFSGLQEQFESIMCEKAELEAEHQEVIKALNVEREARNEFTQHLQEDALHSPTQLSWAQQSAGHLFDGLSPKPASPNQSNHAFHSTPHAAVKSAGPSLLSELQSSLISDTAELDSVRQSLREAEEDIKRLHTMRAQLEEKVYSMSTVAEQQIESHRKELEERGAEVTAMKEELVDKSEQIGKLKSKLTAVTGEKATIEIELDGLRDELERDRAAGKIKMEKYNKEIQDDQKRIEDMQRQSTQLRESLSVSTNQVERLEVILANSSEGLVAMRDEVTSLLGMVVSVNQDGQQQIVNGNTPSHSENVSDTSPHDTYIVTVQGGKQSLSVHVESHTLLSVLQVWDQLRLLRGPLEQFTRSILQRSLAVSTRHISTSTEKMLDDGGNQRVSDLETEMNKLKSKLATRSEEANQLRTIMKARQTTQEVTISSLRSKLDGQQRAHETEVTQLKHKIKTLRKERDDQISLGAMTSRRCQEQFEEIGRVKKKMEELRAENEKVKNDNKLSNMYLERAIKQKLQISVLLEQYQEEEERTRVIPMALSASRV